MLSTRQGILKRVFYLSITLFVISLISTLISAQVNSTRKHNFKSNAKKQIIAYFLTSDEDSWNKLKTIANYPNKFKFTRINLSFVNPRINYNDKNTIGTGLTFTNASGQAFNPSIVDLSALITKIKNSGKQVFITVGGWDYSQGGDGDTLDGIGSYNEPDSQYFKNGTDGGYNYFRTLLLYPNSVNYPIDNTGHCKYYPSLEPSPTNQWCYVIEPKATGETPNNFSSFPYPVDFPKSLLPAGAGVNIPSTDYYQLFAQLTHDIGATGVDVDYEEFWMADWYRVDSPVSNNVIKDSGNYDHNPQSTGPWSMPDLINKYAYIVKSIEEDAKKLGLQVQLTVPSVGAIPTTGPWGSGKQWWGGNLKGMIYNTMMFNQQGIKGKALLNAARGGIGVMTYDVSSNQANSECPFADNSYCPLDKQVAFYMNSFMKEFAINGVNVPIYMGAETETPAYPRPETSEGVWNQYSLPLYKMTSNVLCGGQGSSLGGCDINNVFSVKEINLPQPPSDFKLDKINDYWNSTFTATATNGVLIWEQFKDNPSNLPGYVDKNINNKKYATPTDVENYFNNEFIKK